MLAAVVADTAQHFGRAIVMPNLVPPVLTGADASAYRDRILAHCIGYPKFQPLMTLYLTETTDASDVVAAAQAGIVHAVKLYPAGATTNSASGVRDFDKVRPVLEAMAEIGVPLCVHGEVTDPSVDIFDREAVFIDRVLTPLRAAVPGLKMILEHVTTADGVDFVRDAGDNMAATITTHHLFINRNHILAGGIGRIITAFRLPNVNVIAWHLWLLRHLVRDNFFLAPIARRILILTSNQHAAVQAFIQRQIHCHVWPMCLKLSQRSIN